ncbi:hypothetical protein BJ508DRAFT_333387 [Ascobolus immersus RN42]|uniref:F-box domain-containing protein n=1 Tax=Ascobolus immersus RN42 TaxID=1160509 RepID=A0A3N4HLM8_ASCIM|nr:hypothetical protein BJ508DRAFT_333387 [Ascobolus immersus RN42]
MQMISASHSRYATRPPVPPPILRLPNELLEKIFLAIDEPTSYPRLTKTCTRLAIIGLDPLTRRKFTDTWFLSHNDKDGWIEYITRYIHFHAVAHKLTEDCQSKFRKARECYDRRGEQYRFDAFHVHSAPVQAGAGWTVYQLYGVSVDAAAFEEWFPAANVSMSRMELLGLLPLPCKGEAKDLELAKRYLSRLRLNYSSGKRNMKVPDMMEEVVFDVEDAVFAYILWKRYTGLVKGYEEAIKAAEKAKKVTGRYQALGPGLVIKKDRRPKMSKLAVDNYFKMWELLKEVRPCLCDKNDDKLYECYEKKWGADTDVGGFLLM